MERRRRPPHTAGYRLESHTAHPSGASETQVARIQERRKAMRHRYQMRTLIVRALVSGGIAAAGVGLSTGPAQAAPLGGGPWTWCPGDPLDGAIHTATGRGSPPPRHRLGYESLPYLVERLVGARQRRPLGVGRARSPTGRGDEQATVRVSLHVLGNPVTVGTWCVAHLNSGVPQPPAGVLVCTVKMLIDRAFGVFRARTTIGRPRM